MPLNYEQSKVYKIWSPNGDKIYVGSTTKQYLSQRMTAHRKDYNLWKIGKCCLTTSYLLFDEYGLDNCFIELLEAKTFTSKDELSQLEGKYIRELKCVNKHIIGRDKKEYYEDNKEHIKEKSRQHYHDNKDYALERNKKYYEDNKEKILEQNKHYREKNKEMKSEMNKRIIECSCGKTYTHCNKSRHNKSVFHINNKKE